MYEYTTRKVSDLTEYANNSRTHSDEQIDQIAKSIEAFGFTNPILIDEHNGIIAGHGRLMGANKLGMDEVPCIVLAGLTDAQKKAYVIADNQLALNAGWDLDMLKLEIESLDDLDFDTTLLGFDDATLASVMLEKATGEIDPQAEWEGMPEFEQNDETSYRKVIVHFENEDDIKEFFSIIGQTYTNKTKSIWFPEAEIKTYADKCYR